MKNLFILPALILSISVPALSAENAPLTGEAAKGLISALQNAGAKLRPMVEISTLTVNNVKCEAGFAPPSGHFANCHLVDASDSQELPLSGAEADSLFDALKKAGVSVEQEPDLAEISAASISCTTGFQEGFGPASSCRVTAGN